MKIISFAWTTPGQRYRERNLRAIFHHVSAMQRDALRGVRADYGGVVYLALPPNSGREAADQWSQPPPRPRASRAGPSPFRGLKEACEVLGVREDAPVEVVNAAYRALQRSAEGNEEKMKRTNSARDFVYERRDWAAEQTVEEPLYNLAGGDSSQRGGET